MPGADSTPDDTSSAQAFELASASIILSGFIPPESMGRDAKSRTLSTGAPFGALFARPGVFLPLLPCWAIWGVVLILPPGK